MIVQDCLALDASGLTLTRDGYLVGDARVSRAGNVQKYYGHEIGLTGDEAHKVFGVYRDPDVVFHEDSMRSLAGRPVTRNHPAESVTADNWGKLAKGQVGGVIKRDGEHVVAPMAIMDAEAVREVQSGARALSAGYTVEIIKDEGVSPDGEPYQYRQAGALRFNHVAYLPGNNPRAGNTRLGDDRGAPPHPSNKRRSRPMTDNLRKVVLDGISIETTDQGAEAISKLQKQLSDAGAALDIAKADHAKALAAKDAELAKKDAEIDDLKAKVIDGAALDALVAERATIVAKAKALDAKVVIDGKSNAEIKRAVLGDAVKDKSDAYVDAAFDLKTADLKPADALRETIADAVTVADAMKARDAAKAARVARLNGATEAEA